MSSEPILQTGEISNFLDPKGALDTQAENCTPKKKWENTSLKPSEGPRLFFLKKRI